QSTTIAIRRVLRPSLGVLDGPGEHSQWFLDPSHTAAVAGRICKAPCMGPCSYTPGIQGSLGGIRRGLVRGFGAWLPNGSTPRGPPPAPIGVGKPPGPTVRDHGRPSAVPIQSFP